MPKRYYNFPMTNITRVLKVDFEDSQTPESYFDDDGNFVDENGFFIRAGTTGYLRYCPVNNGDDEYIEKEFTGSEIFVDPERCRKIFKELEAGSQREMATDVYVGYGV